MALKVERYVVGPVMTNCYFAINEDTGEALVVDPGDSADALIGKLREKGRTPRAVLLTHGHFDHASAAQPVADAFKIPIYAEEHERETLENPAVNLCGMTGGRGTVYRADIFVRDGDILDLAGFSIQVFHTPGHTKGGCCYYLEKEKAVFAGDTLFCQSVGRTDFPGGSMGELIRSIKEKLMTLPDDVTVYTGHEEITTIGAERRFNPFL